MTTAMHEPERFRSPEYLAVIEQKDSSDRLQIPDACLRQMRQEAERGYPHEICGLLTGTMNASGWLVCDVRPVANLNHERAADRFELDPAGYQAIDRELRGSGTEIIGVYHSHPDCPPRPSPTDLGSAWEGFAYPIISVYQGKSHDVRCWTINEEHSRFAAVEIVEHTAHE
ncbi:M67 family metallopeptidase [Mariprofundus erugo]|uniref:M67 family metallopeptidase n=1 Tax=Mariprofundus erugo TaxID=2528639 RepID=UPI001EE7D9CA|nr:M67 family metallopeptidase [Mariprofundus erugo]